MIVGIPYSLTDDKEWLDFTVSQASKYADEVLVITDRGAPSISLPAGVQMWAQGRGVGRARNVAAQYALSKDQCLLFMDSHMVILSDPTPLCAHTLAQPKIVLVEGKPNKYQVGSGYTLGSFLDKNTWKWGYIYRGLYTIMTTEPSYAVSPTILQRLIEIQGVYTVVPGWGMESFDPTLSAARLGYVMDIVPEVVIGHVYKVGSPSSWSARAVSTDCTGEPFCGKLGGSVYFNLIKWGKCIYALKHYGRTQGLPVEQDVCSLVPQLDQDTMNRVNAFNQVAPYTIDDVYNFFERALSTMSWSWVGQL